MGAFICPACDFILDTSFLGDGITDDAREEREASMAAQRPLVSAFGPDAMILGDAAAEDQHSDLDAQDAGLSPREVTHARFYIGGPIAQLMRPDAIPELVPDAMNQSVRMTPFERHMLELVNGKRSVERIVKKSGMAESEAMAAVALLADKGVLRLRGFKRPSSSSSSSMQRPKVDATRVVSMDTRLPLPSVSPSPPLLSASPADFDEDPPTTMTTAAKPVTAAPAEAERTMLWSTNTMSPPVQSVLSVPDAPAIAPLLTAPSVPTAPPLLSTVSKITAPDESSQSDRTRVVPGLLHARVRPAESLQEPEERSVASERPRISMLAAAARDDGDVVDAGFSSLKAAHSIDDSVWGGESAVFSDIGPVSSLPPGAAPLNSSPQGDEHINSPKGTPEGRNHRNDVLAVEPAIDDEAVDDAAADDAAPDGPSLWPPSIAEGPVAVSSAEVMNLAGSSLDGQLVSELALDADGHEPDEPEAPTPAVPAQLAAALAGELGDEDLDDDDAFAPMAPAPVRLSSEEGKQLVAELEDDAVVGFGPLGSELELPPLSEPPDESPVVDADDGFIEEAPASLLGALVDEVEDDDDDVDDVDDEPTPPPRLLTLDLQPIVVVEEEDLPDPSPPPVFVAPSMQISAPLPRSATPTASLERAPTPAPAAPAAPAGPSVSFDIRKKAQRIFDEARKEIAAGRLSSARMNVKLAVQFNPYEPSYQELLAELDRNAGASPNKGRQAPREVQLFEEASAAEAKGDHQRACSLLREAIGINGKAAAIHNRLGVILSTKLKQHAVALDHLRIAIELEPGSMVFLNNFSKITGLLEAQLEREPQKRGLFGGRSTDEKAKPIVSKMRPKVF